MSSSEPTDPQLPNFSGIRPDAIEPSIDAVLDSNRRRLEQLIAQTAETADFESAILPLEELGTALQRVWAPVSHLHGVCNSEELREAYNNCLPKLARYETEISQDERVCALYKKAAEKLTDSTDQAARRLVELALRDFRLAGVDLPDDRKQRFREIAEQLSAAQARFEQNVLGSMAAWSHHETRPERLQGLPDSLLEQAAAQAREQEMDGWLLRLDQPTYMAVMTHADDRDLRRTVYRAWITRASDQAPSPAEFDNTDVMEQILALRHEAAQLVGFDQYADYSLASKMAGSVPEVLEFLNDLAARSHTVARQELEQLERFAGQALAAWDIAYYSEKLRADRFAISDKELRPYFPLEQVLDGLFRLVERVYGLVIEPREGVDVWRPEVRYYTVRDHEGQQIGGFYTDLFARQEKRSGAWMDECLNRATYGEHQQLPVAHLVCNFAAGSPSLLNHDEVLTLFHEFGHTLHHILTRVDYPGVAGINGVPWDAVELPSQFMENFAWQPDIVRTLSRHHQTGEPLPDELLERLCASRSFQAGLQMARQLEFALFDLRMHAEYDPRRGGRIDQILEQVRRQVAVVRHPEYNRFPHAFSHIFGGGYAAGYYSYKWAEILAADAWSAFEARGIFDPELARRFRETILEVGGSVDIADAFRAFRGREPRVEPLLIQHGILPPESVNDAA